jgi:hypothetical protein
MKNEYIVGVRSCGKSFYFNEHKTINDKIYEMVNKTIPINYNDIVLLKEIVQGWDKQIDEFTGGFISTKYSRLQNEVKLVIKFLEYELNK